MAREKPIAFSPKQIAEYPNNYKPANLLGSCAFGVVYKGLLVDGVEVAFKVLTNNNSARIVEDQFMEEVGTLGRICHMHLVRLYGFCFDLELKALVYEYMENGSLDKLLFDESKQVDLEKLHDIDVQIAQGTLTKPSTAITSIFFSISMERTELAVENNDLPRSPPDLAVEENDDLGFSEVAFDINKKMDKLVSLMTGGNSLSPPSQEPPTEL
ncbi:hypothetical protein ACE6H2_026547 [Prunus campanulata]